MLLLIIGMFSSYQSNINGSTNVAVLEQSDDVDVAITEKKNADKSENEDTTFNADADTKTIFVEENKLSNNGNLETESVESVPDHEEEDNVWTIQTKYFSVNAPKNWKEIFYCKQDDMSIYFMHQKSHDDGYGGYLFGIQLFSVDDPEPYEIPEAWILGGVEIPDLGEYNVWHTGPSDVQYSPECSEEYCQCLEEVPDILSTLSFHDGCYFSPTPFEATFENDEGYIDNTISDPGYSTNALSDSALEYNAGIYLSAIASNLESEQKSSGNTIFMAAPNVFITVVNRSEEAALLRGEINYWFRGGDPDGTISVELLLDPYSGELISYIFN